MCDLAKQQVPLWQSFPSSGKEPLSAEKFLSILNRSNDMWWSDRGQRWVFRGHGDLKYKLLPSAWRKDSSNTLYDRIKISLTDEKDLTSNKPLKNATPTAAPYQRVNTWNQYSKKAIIDFGKSALEQGFDVPENHDQLAMLAQHHGIPTALLDWTLDPLVAAHFAVRSALSKPIENQPSELCVWAFRIDTKTVGFWNEFLSEYPIAFKVLYDPAPSKNIYLRKQRGVFVQMQSAEPFFEHWGRWPSMLEYCDPQHASHPQTLERPILLCIKLKRNQFRKLNHLLERHGISRAKLMPTLDNVAQDIIDSRNF